MHLVNKQFRTSDNSIINYYEIDNNKPILLIIHAQGTSAVSYSKRRSGQKSFWKDLMA